MKVYTTGLLELFMQLGSSFHQERKKQERWVYVVSPAASPAAGPRSAFC